MDEEGKLVPSPFFKRNCARYLSKGYEEVVKKISGKSEYKSEGSDFEETSENGEIERRIKRPRAARKQNKIIDRVDS